MADKLGLATISNIFRDLYGKPIAESAYRWWLTLFDSISNEDLYRAAMYLIEGRERSSMVTPGEISWALRSIGVYVKRKVDPMEAALAQQFPEAEGERISLAEFRKTDKEGAQAISSYMGGNDGLL